MKIRDEQLRALASTRRDDAAGRLAATLARSGFPAEVSADRRRVQPTGCDLGVIEIDGGTTRWLGPAGSTLVTRADDGRLRELGGAGGPRIAVELDERYRLTRLGRIGGPGHRFEHDGEGRLTRVTYPDDSTTRLDHDDAGRLTRIADRTGAATRFAWAPDLRENSVIDPLGREVRVVRGAGGRVTAVYFPDDSRLGITFDDPRRKIRLQRRDGTESVQNHAADGRLVGIEWPDGEVARFTWGPGDQLRGASNADITLEFDHDEQGRPIAERSDHGAVRTELDADGRVLAVRNPFGDEFHCEYDAEGRLVAVCDWAGGVSRFDYAGNELASIRYANGVICAFARDDPGLRGSIETRGPTGAVLRRTDWERDGDERLQRLQETGHRPATVRRFSHDAEGRLLAEVRDGRPVVVCAYDAKGNLIRVDAIERSVGAMDEPRRVGGSEILYDGMGNMTALPGRPGRPEAMRCAFAADGTLRRVSTDGGVVEMRYDPLGRRIEKRSRSGIHRFGWNGEHLLWEETQAGPAAPRRRRDYLFLPGTATPFAFREAGQIYYIQSDVRGAAVRAFDAEGRIVWEAEYDSFGAAKILIAAIRQPWRLLGQYEDEETGLHYNFARYYAPWLACYLSLDPNWYRVGATNYSYAGNDPWNRADPFGAIAPLLAALLIGGAVGAILGAGISAAVAWATHGNVLEAALVGGITGLFTGIGAVVGTLVGGPVGTFVGSAIGGMIGSFLGSVAKDLILGDGTVCWPCAFRAAGESLLFDILLLGLGKIPGVKRLVQVLGARLRVWLANADPFFDSIRRELAKSRLGKMLAQDFGFNISPTSWDQYGTIGRAGSFITDQRAISDIIGGLEGGTRTITRAQATALEQSLGLAPGSLQDGFKIRQVADLSGRNPTPPTSGNDLFRGAGEHLPGGAPEVLVDPIRTVDGDGVITVLEVFVQ